MFSELGQQTMLAAGQKRGADESDGGMMQEMPMSAEQQQQQQVAMMQQQQQSNGQHPGIKRRMVSLASFVALRGNEIPVIARYLHWIPLDRRTRCRKLNRVQCLEWTRRWILQPPFTRLVRLDSYRMLFWKNIREIEIAFTFYRSFRS